MALSVEEREQFLAEPHIGALSVVQRPDRAPLTVPIWYRYSPGGELWVLTEPNSRKTRAIDAAGRFSLMVQRSEPTIRYVSAEGPVIRTAPGSSSPSTCGRSTGCPPSWDRPGEAHDPTTRRGLATGHVQLDLSVHQG